MERDLEITQQQKADAVAEFIDRMGDQIPSVYFVDFVYLPTETFYRNVGFYFTLTEAIATAQDKIAQKYKLDKKLLIYNTNLHLNTRAMMDKIVERFSDEIQDVGVSQAKKTTKMMQEYIQMGDIEMAKKSDLNKHQKQYVIDKIIQNKQTKNNDK